MNYETNKTKLENLVTWMQQDLKDKADKPRTSQKQIDFNIDLINTMVDFYNAAEEMISEQQMNLVEANFNYSRLQADTEKLLIFAQMHGVTPGLVFHYSLEELKQMQRSGIRFRAPELSFDRVMFVDAGDGHIELVYQEKTIQDEETVHKYEDKYFTLKMLATRC